jgi:hypothetical protein
MLILLKIAVALAIFVAGVLVGRRNPKTTDRVIATIKHVETQIEKKV